MLEQYEELKKIFTDSNSYGVSCEVFVLHLHFITALDPLYSVNLIGGVWLMRQKLLLGVHWVLTLITEYNNNVMTQHSRYTKIYTKM